jgi:hypothetical protein
VSDRTVKGVVMIEAFNIMQDRLTRMRLAGDPPDVHITPHIGHRVLGTAALASVIVVLLMSYQWGRAAEPHMTQMIRLHPK